MRPMLITMLLAGIATGQSTFSVPQGSFAGGEVSPLLAGRTDIPQYRAGCEILENFLVVSSGQITRRPGTVFVATTEGSGAARLESFIFSESDAYILEFSDQKLRFFRSGGQIQSLGSAYEIATVFTEAELFELQVYQSANDMYIVHEDHWPQKLTRTDHTDWAIGDAPVENGPFMDENVSVTTVYVDDVNDVSDANMIASDDLFYSGMEGGYWRVGHLMNSQSDSGTHIAPEDGNAVKIGVGAPFNANWTAAAFEGTTKLQVSVDYGVTWIDELILTNDRLLALDVDQNDISDYGRNAQMRVICTERVQGDYDYTLEVESYTHYGVVQIVDINSVTDCNVVIVDEVVSTDTTTIWAEGSWSDYRGHPVSVIGHSGRLLYTKGLEIYFSSLNNLPDGGSNFDNFYPGIEDDDAFWYELSQSRQNPARWIYGDKGNSILLGTLGKVFQLIAFDEISGFLPTNVPKVESAAAISCAKQKPALANATVVYTDRTGKKLHESLYDYNQETITGPDLTVFADHITGDGITQVAYQGTPYPTIWATTSAGPLTSMYYSRPYQVAAWSRHVTDGTFTSVAVIPQDGGEEQVWVVAKRTISGSDVYYVEYLDDLDMDGDIEDAFYVDSGLTWAGGAAVSISDITQASPGVVTVASWPAGLADGNNITIEDVVGMTEVNGRYFEVDDANEAGLTFSLNTTAGSDFDTSGYTAYASAGMTQIVENAFGGLTHLEGEALRVLGDGALLANVSVSGGTVTIGEYVNDLSIGLGYTSKVQPTYANVESPGGTTAPMRKRIVNLYLNAYYSTGGQYGPSEDTLFPIDWLGDGSPQLHTKSVVLRPFGGGRREATYVIIQADPLPMTIRSLIPIYSIE